jgi:hypothetical protein
MRFSPMRPKVRGLVAAALLLAGCGSVFGLDDYEVTDETRCDDELVDLSSNFDHCGDCDTACGSRQLCSDGTCVCEPGFDTCGGSCVDRDTDERHCGACGHACPEDATCKAGACVCDDANLQLCGDACESDCGCMPPGGNGECSPIGCGCESSEGCYYTSTTGWACLAAGSAEEGDACASNEACQAGFLCLEERCRAYCGQGQPCDGDCSPVYVNGEPVADYNFCHALCNPIPTSTLSDDRACPSGERCTLLFAGSSVCTPVNSSAGTRGSRCEDSRDCLTGNYCNATGHCAAFCWTEDDTCTLFGVGLGCRTYVDPVLIDDHEVGECLPTQAAAGCKEACVTDADCSITGTVCVNTTSGDICLNEECMDCFDTDLSCTSNNETCEFIECVAP